MAFETYQCERYIKYLTEVDKTKKDIYKLIFKSPFTVTQLGKAIGLDYEQMRYRRDNFAFTNEQLRNLLNFIK